MKTEYILISAEALIWSEVGVSSNLTIPTKKDTVQ